MKKLTFLLILSFFFLGGFIIIRSIFRASDNDTGAPPYAFEDLELPQDDPYLWLKNWRRPEGPAKVGLQAGHLKNSELPDELNRLRANTGSSGGGKSEWEVNLAIAQDTKEILEEKGINVDILPATIPKGYWADVFVAIHADGSTDTSKSGFKAASPRRDFSGKTSKLLEFVEEEYGLATNLEKDPNVTRNMRGYYAFAWWRYEHSVHPMTASIILETGFLTNPADRKIIVSRPEISAQGIASGIIRFLETENLLSNDQN